MTKTRYRVVRDSFSGYEAQFRVWWFPFWLPLGFTNTHTTTQKAQEYCVRPKVVTYYDPAAEKWRPGL